jgi:hypothetical protein
MFPRSFAVVLGLFVLGALSLGAAPATAKAGKKGAVSLAPLDAAEIARQLRAAAATGTPHDFDALGRALAADVAKAGPVLDLLAQEKSAEATTLATELLVWMARGNEAREGAKAGTMPTAELGARAGALLEHEDPFVRGLAEWALAIRLGSDHESAEVVVNGHRVPEPWPDAASTEWYRKWLALSGEGLIELDHVRQAAALGQHRSRAALLQSAEGLVSRATKMAAYGSIQATAEQDRRLALALQTVRQRFAALRQVVQDAPQDLVAQRKLWLQVRAAVREVALANPDLNFTELVFATRHASRGNGNITVGRWNIHAPGGDILVQSGFSPGSPVRPLLQGRLGPGHLRGLDLSWEADKLVFAYVRQPRRTREEAAAQELRPKHGVGGYFGQGVGAVEEMSRLFEVRLDGSGLRQLTQADYHTDQEPCYLPNGDIAFVSDRSNFGSQCAGALEQDNMILNLYRCDPDGKNLRPLSNNKDFDRHPHVMDNGQLLFLHWEYQERHLWNTHTLWTCRPDGTMTDAIFKQHIESGPMSLREARQVWGQDKLVAIACGHHNNDQGALFLCDYAQGINEKSAMRNVTPGVSETEGGYGKVPPVPEGGVADVGGHYMFPYPLSGKSFLASYSYKRPEQLAGLNFSLYYLDVWGNKELIHRDKRLSVAYLMPLRRTPRPPVIKELPVAQAAGPRHGVAVVSNVHAGWPAAEAGRVKYLRIAQKVPWPCVPDETKACGFNDLHWMPAAWEHMLGFWDWGHARVIGLVPVESDGSAHFKVPADQTVYFQALDENYLEVRRMRSNVTFVAGETRTCIGCHESKTLAPPAAATVRPLALGRPPSQPEPPVWGDRVVPDYLRDIQPILDAHCVSCHGEQEPKGGLEFSRRIVDGFAQSYRTLFGLKAGDPTPVGKYYAQIWYPDRARPTDEAAAAAKKFYRDAMRTPAPAQLVSIADWMSGAEVTRLRQFGSSQSRLITTLLRDPGHRKEVKLSRDEWISLVTWVDLNAQYWGTFVDKDAHFLSRQAKAEKIAPPRRVYAIFPDPWLQPPTGNWGWKDENTVAVLP